VRESPEKTTGRLELFIIEGGSEKIRLRKHENNSVELNKKELPSDKRSNC